MVETAGFYTLFEMPDKRGYIGALLVTDDIGKPEEFRVTYPVRPTMVQKQLYGRSLLPHVGVELCGKPLFESLTNRPQVLLVQWDYLLGLGDVLQCPVVHVAKSAEQLELVSGANQPKDRLEVTPGLYQPVDVSYPRSYSEERRFSTLVLLEQFFVAIDPVEPFERIQGALKILGEQEERFR